MATSEASRSNLQLLLRSLVCEPLTSMSNLVPDNRHLPIILPEESYPPVEAPVKLIILSDATSLALAVVARSLKLESPSRLGVRLGKISIGTREYKPWYNAPRSSLIHFGEQQVHGGLGHHVGYIHEVFFWPSKPVVNAEVPEGHTLITVAVYGNCPSTHIDPFLAFPYTCARICSTKISSYIIISPDNVHGPVAIAPWRCAVDTQVAIACPV